MFIAYLDESGTPEVSGSTSHFVLMALVIDGRTWKAKRAAVRGVQSVRAMRKEFAKTSPYLHLTYDHRRALLRDIADAVRGWNGCYLFADCIDKTVFRRKDPTTPPFEEAFDQVVTRFHRFLENQSPKAYGMIVQDRNETVAARLTALMRKFHKSGTRWTSRIPLLVETPLFVDSGLTSLVQVADVCAYATRRYLENGEEDLFDRIYARFHVADGRRVGVRHYRGARACTCRICAEH